MDMKHNVNPTETQTTNIRYSRSARLANKKQPAYCNNAFQDLANRLTNRMHLDKPTHHEPTDQQKHIVLGTHHFCGANANGGNTI